MGQRSNGPTGLISDGGVWCHLPNAAVEYPLPCRVRAIVAALRGRKPEYPGADVAISVVPPMPTEWWLRPVIRAWRVGEHSAVTWKRV